MFLAKLCCVLCFFYELYLLGGRVGSRQVDFFPCKDRHLFRWLQPQRTGTLMGSDNRRKEGEHYYCFFFAHFPKTFIARWKTRLENIGKLPPPHPHPGWKVGKTAGLPRNIPITFSANCRSFCSPGAGVSVQALRYRWLKRTSRGREWCTGGEGGMGDGRKAKHTIRSQRANQPGLGFCHLICANLRDFSSPGLVEREVEVKYRHY